MQWLYKTVRGRKRVGCKVAAEYKVRAVFTYLHRDIHRSRYVPSLRNRARYSLSYQAYNINVRQNPTLDRNRAAIRVRRQLISSVLASICAGTTAVTEKNSQKQPRAPGKVFTCDQRSHGYHKRKKETKGSSILLIN